MAQIVGDNDPNFLQGGDDHDLIQSGHGDDVLYGMAGNDTLDGGDGADYLHGGAGLDYADYFWSTAVLVDLGKNSASGGQAFGDYFVSVEGVLGSGQGDAITGDDGFNVFEGRGGNDLLKGAGGSDLIYGQVGDDNIQGGDGNDDLLGGVGADQIDGGAGFDIASYAYSSSGVSVNLAAHTTSGGEAEGDTLTNIERVDGSAFADVLTGDAGNNELYGGEGGFDSLNGGGGNDRLTASGFMAGGGGSDSIFGGYFFGSTLVGNTGNDYLIGNGHIDTLSGGDGNDTLAGGGGGDRLSGGLGADTFWFTSEGDSKAGAGAQDLVVDFSKAEGDKVDVSWLFDKPDDEGDNDLFTFIGAQAFHGVEGELRFSANRVQNVTFIQADVNGDGTADLQARFSGIISFTAGDFIL